MPVVLVVPVVMQARPGLAARRAPVEPAAHLAWPVLAAPAVLAVLCWAEAVQAGRVRPCVIRTATVRWRQPIG